MTDSPRLLATPTIHGTKPVRVGNVSYDLPADAQVRFAQGGQLMYALSSGTLYCFSERGQITIPDAVRTPLARLLFGGGRR